MLEKAVRRLIRPTPKKMGWTNVCDFFNPIKIDIFCMIADIWPIDGKEDQLSTLICDDVSGIFVPSCAVS
jgi:hypothetical protein